MTSASRTPPTPRSARSPRRPTKAGRIGEQCGSSVLPDPPLQPDYRQHGRQQGRSGHHRGQTAEAPVRVGRVRDETRPRRFDLACQGLVELLGCVGLVSSPPAPRPCGTTRRRPAPAPRRGPRGSSHSAERSRRQPSVEPVRAARPAAVPSRPVAPSGAPMLAVASSKCSRCGSVASSMRWRFSALSD